MAIQNQFLFCIVAVAGLLASTNGAEPIQDSVPFDRSSFPAGFIFGAGSNAFSVEGAADIDGKTPSIWDTFAKNHPEKIKDHSTPNDGVDFYHRYKEDIKLMKLIGLDSFRFSLSWPRLLPNGKINGGANPRGVKFYNDLIDELIANDIKPFVTLFHWDLPQALEDQYGGFLSSEIVNDFRDYVDFCFKTFGDRVKHWVTISEPNYIAMGGYVIGNYAPGRCSKALRNCTVGDSATEPYIVAHNLLLSHATAVKLYKDEYQAKQKGQIGITILIQWYKPKTESAADREAATRMLDFLFGWFAHPITYGDYPKIMRTLVEDRLPKFTEAESKMLKGSYDFLGIDYYSPKYAEAPSISDNNDIPESYVADTHVKLSLYKDDVPVGTPTGVHWIFIDPKGLKDSMLYIKDKYSNSTIYITENGVIDLNTSSVSIDEFLKDDFRIKTYQGHLLSLLEAIKEGANVKAYYAWSFFDTYEWDAGFTVRFGMVYVDYKNNLERHLKDSAYWFKNFLAAKQEPVAFDEL